MTYIVQRHDRFYVVAYDGLDPLTGKERRRWHTVGHDRGEADALASRLDRERISAPPKIGGPITVGQFLRETWLPQKRRQVRATTAYRYAWFVDRYIIPAIGDVHLRRLRVDHLDALYVRLAATGGQNGTGLAPKTVLERAPDPHLTWPQPVQVVPCDPPDPLAQDRVLGVFEVCVDGRRLGYVARGYAGIALHAVESAPPADGSKESADVAGRAIDQIPVHDLFEGVPDDVVERGAVDDSAAALVHGENAFLERSAPVLVDRGPPRF